MMSEAELKELADNIKANGLQMPVVFWSPDPRDRDLIRRGEDLERVKNLYLLDGRNRLDALEAGGFKLVNNGKVVWDSWCKAVMHVAGEDPYAFVLSANIQRRHLTAEQKRDLIAKVLKAKPEQSNREIAKQTKSDHKTVAKVRKERESTGEIPQLEKTVRKD